MTASHGNTYDDMNRLTGASGMETGGKSDDGSVFSSYVMTMSYNQMSSPQRYELTKMSQSDTKVTENEYLYSTDTT